MYIINGTKSDANQGSNIQGAPSTAPPVAPVAQSATTVGEQKGANKRARDTMVAPGRNVQTDSNNQSSDAATNMANSTAIVSVVPKARIRRGIREVAASVSQSSSSIPVAQATTFIAQAIVLAGHATSEITLHPTVQAVHVASTPQQPAASAPRANLATPEYHYSTPGRQQSSYDPTQYDGNTRNNYGNRNSRFATSKGKGKGKGKAYNAKSTWGAMPKDYDPDQLVILLCTRMQP
jgi:hypothetical protein